MQLPAGGGNCNIRFSFVPSSLPAIPRLSLDPALLPSLLLPLLLAQKTVENTQIITENLLCICECLSKSRPHYHVAVDHLHMQIRLMRAEL